MKPIIQNILTLALSLLVGFSTVHAADWTAGMKEGNPALKSMGPLAFGPDGILFVADTKGAAVVAIATGDTKPSSGTKPVKVEGINQKIAGLLGSTADNILINDMVVNPASRSVYLAVSRGRGPDAMPVLVRVKGAGDLEVVALDKVKFSRGELPDAPVDGVLGGGQSPEQPAPGINHGRRVLPEMHRLVLRISVVILSK